MPNPMQSEPVALLPCPFCQGKAALRSNVGKMCTSDHAWITCTECHGEGPEKVTEDEAIASWNARLSPQGEAQGLVERCESWASALQEHSSPILSGNVATLLRQAAALITAQAAEIKASTSLLDEAVEALDRIQNYSPAVNHEWATSVRAIARTTLARIRSKPCPSASPSTSTAMSSPSTSL